jgi:signal-transduction protein with cAMP-binding, CBS, and nucleotidyltransferase domain
MKATAKIIQRKKPFQHFTINALEELSRSSVVNCYKRGESIFNEGDNDRKSVFLLSGKISLCAADGRSPQIITPFQEKSALPLSSIKPRKYTAVAETHNTCVFWVHDLIVEHIRSKHGIDGKNHPLILRELVSSLAARG